MYFVNRGLPAWTAGPGQPDLMFNDLADLVPVVQVANKSITWWLSFLHSNTYHCASLWHHFLISITVFCFITVSWYVSQCFVLALFLDLCHVVTLQQYVLICITVLHFGTIFCSLSLCYTLALFLWYCFMICITMFCFGTISIIWHFDTISCSPSLCYWALFFD